MNLSEIKIFMKKSPNTNNKFNKDLLKFLKNNITSIVDAGYKIRLIVVNKSNIDKLMQLNIKSTPSLVMYDKENKICVLSGVDNIINHIVMVCESKLNNNSNNKQKPDSFQNKQSNRKTNDINEIVDVKEYLNDIINSPAGDSNDLDDVLNNDDIREKMSKMTAARDKKNNNQTGLNPNRVNHTNFKQTTSFDTNNDIIDGMDENDELTQIKDSQGNYKELNISDLIDDDDEALKKFWENAE